MHLSFIVCTYNPDLRRLRSVLNSLLNQSFTTRRDIEIILIDNRSNDPITSCMLDIPHERVNIIREMTPGLTAARLRGSKVSESSIHVFIDDDNIVAPDYAEQVLALSNKFPNIGVFSSGNILPNYEVEPPEDIHCYWPYLALKQEPKARWANFPRADVLPIGAGMAVRDIVMSAYSQRLEQYPDRRNTDRDGKSLAAGGDTDIGLVACEINLGCGYFPELKLTHMIAKERLETQYLHRLVRDVSYSTAYVLNRSGTKTINGKSFLKECLVAIFTIFSNLGRCGPARRIAARSRVRAHRDAWRAQSSN